MRHDNVAVVKENHIWVQPFRMPSDRYNSINMAICVVTSLRRHGPDTTVWQISSEGHDRPKDLFLTRAYQDQAEGALNHPPRDYWLAANQYNDS